MRITDNSMVDYMGTKQRVYLFFRGNWGKKRMVKKALHKALHEAVHM